MANRINSSRDFTHEKSQQHISDTYFPERTRSNKPFRFDDLIVTLANAHENRRARQVTEWERMRRQNFPAAV
ncbi:MAG TPA: hypothetical protein PLP21_14140 [Pyrinomonadaceae bacterium]|nr:hypothetical protein [Acidobacteriota bacterium]HQZ97457.1 hypothetical protein [Pyrinomonadaceae bacterium]